MAPGLPHRLALVIACCGLWLHSATAWAEETQIAVIVSSETPAFRLDTATLRHIYLKKIFLDKEGRPLVPVNLPPGNALRKAFSRAAVHMGTAQLRTYWNRRYFQGVSPPYVLGSQTAVVQFVANTPGAIGYVRPCYLNATVRRVLLLSVPAGEIHGAGTRCP